MFTVTQVERVLVVRVSAGLKEWTRCLLDITDETIDNTDAPTGPKPGGDPMLQVNLIILEVPISTIVLFDVLANQIGAQDNQSSDPG